jgi:hypothetical protein
MVNEETAMGITTFIRTENIKRPISITKDILVYVKNYNTLMLKVTDYEKGYWAQAPISTKQEVMELIAILQSCLKNEVAVS